MTMSRVQFAAIVLLTASAVGIGVGWLPRWLSGGEKPEVHPQAAVMPVLVPQAAEQHDEVKRLIAAFRKEMKAASTPRGAKQSEEGADKLPVCYQGKPASFWLAQFRDRDRKFRQEAVEPLVAIAEVDRSVIPALVNGMNATDVDSQKRIAGCLAELNPSVPETAAVLFRGDLELATVLRLLKKIDPRGEVTLPLVQAALSDKQLRVRAGLILIAFDKQAHLPIPLLVEAFQDGWKRTYYYPPGENDDNYVWCCQNVLAAWLLRQAGVEAREAVPALVESLRYASEKPEDEHSENPMTNSATLVIEGPGLSRESFSPFETALKTKNMAEWFASTLTVVDPRGEEAIPLLVKTLKENPDHEDQRRKVARALGQYGSRAKAAVPVLLDIVKNKGISEAASTSLPTVLVSRPPVLDTASSLHDVALETLKKIDPKELPGAEPKKPAKKSKQK